jgi:fibro-slime domain-containing protein
VFLVVLSACSKLLGLGDVTYEGGDDGAGGVCGDGVVAGSEQCDDGNRIPFDGCSPTCTIETMCKGGACIATCGDGLVSETEECDDGNRVNGDGCDRNCKLEPDSGFDCALSDQPPADALVIPILYRDMLYNGTQSPPAEAPGHPDFESFHSGLAPGLVQSTLGDDNKPVWRSDVGNGSAAPPSLSGPVDFCWWYHDTDCDDGGSKNPFARPVFLDLAGQPTTLTLKQVTPGVYQLDDQTFFPLDGLGWNTLAGATAQTDLGVDGRPHNFAFTSELHDPFTYDASRRPTIGIIGDDDVWVFINGHLAIDLGGVHAATSGSVTLDSTQVTRFGLVNGGMYSIDLFHAKRHTQPSTFKLTLSGFVRTVTTCTPICGDGRVVGNEACDDGPGNGMPGHCNATCSGRL